ncbi:MAG: hypothetical protein AAGI51_09570 [Pseudomonadota bacterium]
MRVAALLNHDAPHQVPHCAPFAFALSVLRPDWDVAILCSSEAEADFAADIGRLHPGHACRIERLRVPAWARALDPVARHVAFVRKSAVQRANLDRLSRLDALITPEKTSLNLRRDPRMGGVRLIWTGHGAGDRYAQFGAFDPRIDAFDLTLLPGPGLARRMRDAGLLRGAPYAIVGYPKLELAAPARAAPPVFDNGRPTALYNPTQNREGSSWHRHGRAVLEVFARQDRWNLIFAPHVVLFSRSLTKGARFPRGLADGPGLRVDRGSRASVDMTYLSQADLYLGDMSSQIYEFIARPRPAVFIDPFEDDRPRDFPSWRFGPVIRGADELEAALTHAVEDFERYRPIQEAAAAERFAVHDAPASVCGARAAAAFLETGRVEPRFLLPDDR